MSAMRNEQRECDPYSPPDRHTKIWRLITDDFGNQEWRRQCPKCLKWKLPSKDFYLRNSRGKTILGGYCRKCKISYDRILLTRDEEFHREYLEARRMKRHEERTSAGLKTFPQKGTGMLKFPYKEIYHNHDPEKLPIGPLREWIIKRVKLYGQTEVANSCGLDVRAINRIERAEYPTLSFAFVDRVLTHEGSTFIWDLYPEEYERLLGAA